MVFCLMGLICQCCCSLQAGLEQVLERSQQDPMTDQLEKLIWIKKKHQFLIDLVQQLISIFKYNELFALHLSYQNTEIRIFGTFALNHRLLFLSATVIVLHVLYMVQCDMT
ncbi:uncharacterized protein LOC26529659 [Drosophila willistoni]|uniref:uncharacterized protein LOC26529659 n=1 Tax=Drosophila willistoni TaxID=7260 RepID=UPI001F074E72|nr:uncharacterized protein LOC26529659 [Drosophila willistoni]